MTAKLSQESDGVCPARAGIGKEHRMLDQAGFDLWANEYDKCVGLSDEETTYPFAGYKDVLNYIYQNIMAIADTDVLDIGFGTGTLTAKLYEGGCHITGQDFSHEMIQIAQAKMPDARLFQGDFAKELRDEVKEQKYDAIVATYSLHHLTLEQKAALLAELLLLLKENGKIWIGDVAFLTQEEQETCRAACGDEWDDDEIYFVVDEFKELLPRTVTFTRMSFCAGVIMIQ